MTERGMKKIGWIPYCTYDEQGTKLALGPWPAFFGTNKKQVSTEVRKNHSFKFKIVPVFIRK